jgi:hypothetical protein
MGMLFSGLLGQQAQSGPPAQTAQGFFLGILRPLSCRRAAGFSEAGGFQNQPPRFRRFDPGVPQGSNPQGCF